MKNHKFSEYHHSSQCLLFFTLLKYLNVVM